MSHYSESYEHDGQELKRRKKIEYKVTHWEGESLDNLTKEDLRCVIDELAQIVEEERQELKRRTEILLKIGRN